MRIVSVALLSGFVLFVVGCGKKDEAPPPAVAPAPSGAYGQPPGYPPGYPAPATGYPAPQPGYPQQPAPGTYPQPVPGAPATGGALAVPGPLAGPCSNHSMCITHKCNMQYGKCAFPCETDNDCIQGSYCFKGVPVAACFPKAPGQP